MWLVINSILSLVEITAFTLESKFCRGLLLKNKFSTNERLNPKFFAAHTQAFERSQKAMDFPVWQLSRNAKMLNWIWRNTELYMEAECWNGSASFCIVKGNEGRSEKLLKDPQKWWIFPSTSCLDFLWTLRQCKPKWIQKYLTCSSDPTTNSEVGLELNVESSEFFSDLCYNSGDKIFF